MSAPPAATRPAGTLVVPMPNESATSGEVARLARTPLFTPWMIQADDLPRAHLEADVRHGAHARERLVEVLGDERGRHHSPPAPLNWSFVSAKRTLKLVSDP
jgi:hypothetical protein